MRIKSLSDINSRKFRRPMAIITLPIVLLAFVIDVLHGIWSLFVLNVKQFIWVWKMPSGLKGQKAPEYPDKDTEPITMDDMTQADVIDELDKLAAAGVTMPYLTGEDAEIAGKRLDKKLKNVKTMKEAVGIMIEDIKLNQPKTDQMDQEGAVDPNPPTSLGKHTINPSLVNLVEHRDEIGQAVDKTLDDPKDGSIEPGRGIDALTDGEEERKATAEFETRLKAVVDAPHTLDEINEIKRQPDDKQRAAAVDRIRQRRQKKFLADTILDGTVDKLTDQLKKALPEDPRDPDQIPECMPDHLNEIKSNVHPDDLAED